MYTPVNPITETRVYKYIKFYLQKLKIFRYKTDIFHISAQT